MDKGYDSFLNMFIEACLLEGLSDEDILRRFRKVLKRDYPIRKREGILQELREMRSVSGKRQ
jgi:hypothetical protein